MAGVQLAKEDFKNSTLTFYANKITSDIEPYEVMMDWEAPIMEQHANIVCHNGGDVLEIGFGMGIASDYIQGLSPSSHTIIELHPQVHTNLVAWAVGKNNVTIIHDDWFAVKDTLGQYDGIFYDGIHDEDLSYFHKTFTPNHIKVGGKMTYYNDYDNQDVFNTGAIFSPISVTPDANGYFNKSTYYVPTVQY